MHMCSCQESGVRTLTARLSAIIQLHPTANKNMPKTYDNRACIISELRQSGVLRLFEGKQVVYTGRPLTTNPNKVHTTSFPSARSLRCLYRCPVGCQEVGEDTSLS